MEQNIFDNDRDVDTMGGRIGRAREIAGMTTGEAAVQLGVTVETWSNWEADREEPRANRLNMLAGFLSVSTTWLLHGIGESPASEEFPEILVELEERLAALEEAHARTSEALVVMRNTVQRLKQAEPGDA